MGFELAQNTEADVIGIGEMGIGNTTTSSAVLSVLLEADVEAVTGRGGGITDQSFLKKKQVIKDAIAINNPNKNDVIDVLAKVGGFDIAAMCGAFIGCAATRRPVVIDGFISAVAALCAYKICPNAVKYFVPSHASYEIGYKLAMDAMHLQPLFLLGMQEEFEEDGYEVYEMPTASKITVERFSEFQRAYEYFKETQTYQKDAEEAILKARPSSKAFVITEGSTDWKHMNTALAALKVNPQYTDMLDGLNIEFFEYEPKNSGGDPAKELEMGKDTLLTLCKNMAKIPQKIKYIFIADNDDPNTTKDMSAKNKSFKNWSNNVYSFVLPVPSGRHETPNICIEHLYTDSEIKTEVEENGILRRLYIGNEFDSRGLATNIDRICEKAKKCGSESIDIIEGSKGEKVTAISDSEGKTNYALPKTSFAKYVSENPDKFNFDNFAEIFRIIKAIIEDGETPCLNNQQQ